jgi:hypothetical protein
MRWSPIGRVGTVLLSFLVVAALQAWPLPLHIGTRLTGQPGGDTGIYVWNLWVFRHELVEHGTSPFLTSTILPLNGPVDLSLHNYTVFSDLLALPLIPAVGVIAAFNVVYLINVALAGLGAFLLARWVHRRADLGTTEAWLAGLLFCCAPFLVARSTAHYSLTAAAPLPFFALTFDRACQSQRRRDAAAAGVCLGWAALSDPYYGVYCVLLGGFIAASYLLVIEMRAVPTRGFLGRGIIDTGFVATLLVVVAIRLFGGGSVYVGPVSISMRSVYTPVLLLTLLAAARVLLSVRPRLTWIGPAPMPSLVRVVGLPAAVAGLLLLPELYALVVRAAEGRMVNAPVFWRSSPPGVDLVSLFLPNPNHPLAPGALFDWVSSQPGQFEENVASIPWLALLVLVGAWKYAGYRGPRVWTAIALFSASLAVGPFLRIAGLETYVPTPWAFLRYAPLVGEARMPARFAVLVVLAAAVLFAGAVTHLTRRYPRQRRLTLATVGVLLAFELLPVPRPLYSAEIPAIYRRIASDTRPIRVLELPFGVRDGLSSLGDFSAASQFYQTLHGKPLIGGYLSRVSGPRKGFYRSLPVIDALIQLSEGQRLTDAQLEAARASVAEFLELARLGYVVIDAGRASSELRNFAVEALRLTPVGATGLRELYRPSSPP